MDAQTSLAKDSGTDSISASTKPTLSPPFTAQAVSRENCTLQRPRYQRQVGKGAGMRTKC